MSRRFKTVSELQHHLKDTIAEAIQTKVTDLCIKVVQEYLRKNVYDAYQPDPDSYDRTFELLNSVTVGNINMGRKYATFEVYMDTEKIDAHIRTGRHDYGGWNSHADVYDLDMSEYIPMWVEEGTSGSLWDRNPAQYMYASWKELRNDGKLAEALADALRSEGWDVVSVS